MRIQKPAVKPCKQVKLAAKKQLLLQPKKYFEAKSSNSDGDSNIDSDAQKSNKSHKSHRSNKSNKSSASEHTSDLPDLPIPRSLNWMWIPIKLKNVGWRAFPAVAATEFTSSKLMVRVPVRRQSLQPGWSTYSMREVCESDNCHSTGEYISARAVFSTRQEAEGHVADLEALGLAGVSVQEQLQQKPKQKKRAYGAGKRKKALKSKAVKKQKRPDTAAALEDHTAPGMCKDQGKKQPDQAQRTEQSEQASLEL